jgi:hypothetical protein
MKHLVKALLCLAACVFISQSCVEKDYDWDNIDKNGVLSIPPVMFGNIDTIYIKRLPSGILPPNISLPPMSIAKSDTIKGLFGGDAIKNFFFDGAGTVEIQAKADLMLSISGVTVNVYFSILDSNGNRIENVEIPEQSLTINEKNQVFSIKVASQDMAYMENADDLELTIAISNEQGSAITIDGEDNKNYLFLKEIIVKNGGFHFEL